MTLIMAKGLVKKFNQGKSNEVTIIKSIDLQIDQGSVSILQGPSGSGKTTLLSMLGCMSRPTEGSFYFFKNEVSRWSEKFLTHFRRDHVGVVFQNYNLLEPLTAYDNISLPMLPTGKPASEIKDRIIHLATMLKIKDKLQTKCVLLSGGERQRVAIARALVNQPDLLIADEPTAHLDSQLSLDILDVFSDLKDSGVTLLIATHDPLVSKHTIADRIFYIQDGRLVNNVD